MRKVIVVAAMAALAGCTTVSAVTPGYSLDRHSGDECHAHCQALGMTVGAVVIIANRTGCVCQPSGKLPDAGGASAVAGGAVFAMEQAAEQERSAAAR